MFSWFRKKPQSTPSELERTIMRFKSIRCKDPKELYSTLNHNVYIVALYSNIISYRVALERHIRSVKSATPIRPSRYNFEPISVSMLAFYLDDKGNYIDVNKEFSEFRLVALELLEMYHGWENAYLDDPEVSAKRRVFTPLISNLILLAKEL